jgi:hypothetical protein
VAGKNYSTPARWCICNAGGRCDAKRKEQGVKEKRSTDLRVRRTRNAPQRSVIALTLEKGYAR